ncbi:helix-turn-helix domain-containing protein [Saccharopolyspora sp. 6M]|uniref:helix-turn-helix domain-containing protein n=1 Tax=Saccharopolyspora sp. 6M TaxID=2877237 RepID=UPI001CD589BD|nr:helix-turn-helix transcriptional regulator [Saccharopolyspora sp. 6M]MCA1226439.1 helix-turn-helix transcriptional regulator [Saccharopolyspora sp. 6M]
MGNALGDFLRARRELVTPAEVGLAPGTGLRRVPGLRREEVATLAGISVEYYLRLEQGRDRSPSPQVIEAIAGVLQLDAEGVEHLTALASPRPRRRARREPQVPRGLELLLRTLNVPALVCTKYGEVLAVNALSRELLPSAAPGTNRLRALFTEPEAQHRVPDWEEHAADAVAHLRAQSGADVEDERLHALIGELSMKSERFRTLWARHDVRRAHGSRFRVRHAKLCEVELLAEKFAVPGDGGLEALLLHAEPGTPSATALTRLRNLVDEQATPNR